MRKDYFEVIVSAYHDEVTGSRIMLSIIREERQFNILIDCGYYQELKYRRLNYYNDLNVNKIDAIVVTHNHIDHIGLIPKLVRQGYRNPIYVTNITKKLLPNFLFDSSRKQRDETKKMREEYPDDAYKFEPLYYKEDVENTLKLCRGIDFGVTFEVVQGVSATFFVNGHILGAAMLLIECFAPNKKPLNFLFTGDYKLKNAFFKVPKLPRWVRKKEIIMVHEATYGTTNSCEVKVCFEKNLLEAFRENKSILIGAFAQGRFQEVLYDLKKLKERNLIPSNYRIIIDGPLGIETTKIYKKILEDFNPKCADFLPEKNLEKMIMDPNAREKILDDDDKPVILVTTSGMLSNGPAQYYVPIFLEHKNAMIHLIGYAAEETLARKLLESKDKDSIKIGNQIYQKNAVVKTTREKSSHATVDEMINFINSFKNIRFLAINHGETNVKTEFEKNVQDNCFNVKETGILNRTWMYAFYQFTNKDDKYSDIRVKQQKAKLQTESLSDKAQKKQNIKNKKAEKRRKKAEKKASQRKGRRKKKKR